MGCYGSQTAVLLEGHDKGFRVYVNIIPRCEILEEGSPTGRREGSLIQLGFSWVPMSFSHMKKMGVTSAQQSMLHISTQVQQQQFLHGTWAVRTSM